MRWCTAMKWAFDLNFKMKVFDLASHKYIEKERKKENSLEVKIFKRSDK